MNKEVTYISRDDAILYFTEQLNFVLEYLKSYDGDLDLYLLDCFTYKDVEGPHGFLELPEPKILEWLERIEKRIDTLSNEQIRSIFVHYLLPEINIEIK